MKWYSMSTVAFEKIRECDKKDHSEQQKEVETDDMAG